MVETRDHVELEVLIEAGRQQYVFGSVDQESKGQLRGATSPVPPIEPVWGVVPNVVARVKRLPVLRNDAPTVGA